MTRRLLAGGTRRSVRGAVSQAGTTLVEFAVAMAVTLLLLALVPAGIQTVSDSTSYARGTSLGASRALAVVQRLQDQVTSASQICLPTVLTTTGPTVAAGFGLRVMTLSHGRERWVQWYLDTAHQTVFEQVWPATWTAQDPVPGWVRVGETVVNDASAPPFALPAFAVGSPQTLDVHVVVDVHDGHRSEPVRLKTTMAALNTPYATNPDVACLAGPQGQV